MRDFFRYLIVFVITLILGYIILFSGIWVLTVIAGFIPSIIYSKKYLKALISSFSGGIISSLLFLFNYIALGGPIFKIAYFAGAVAGLPGSLFLIISILLTGIYCIIGSIIGTYIRKII
jgi:hypothetical protein